MQRLLFVLSRLDWLLFGSSMVLISFGLAAIYSVALSTESTDFGNLEKQLVAIAIGLAIVIFLSASNYKLLRSWTLVIYVVGILLLIGVLFFGSTIRGTTGWFDLGLFSFQPVEFMKIALVLTLAKYFSESARRQFGWRELLASGILTGIPVGLTMLQPDLGSALMLVGIWTVLIFFAGLKWRQALLLGAFAVIFALFAWFVLFDTYQHERILTFMDPSRDPLGRGYNVTQAIIAVGSGEWLGRGLGFGSQSQLKFLPESQTDFIFAVIAEELGFVGVFFILGAFALLFARLFRLIRLSREDYTTYLLLGVVAIIFLQVLVNIGMNLGLLPVTGIGLPLVSYGGSSIIMALALLGIAESVAVHTSSS